MSQDFDKTALRQIKELCYQDKKLADEVSAKMQHYMEEMAKASDELPTMAAEEGPLSSHERDIRRRQQESIVRAMARPVLLIRDNTFVPEFIGPDSDVWKNRLSESRAVLDKAIPAVGRIEVQNHPGIDWVGTGWLVENNTIVTNRHVAREFARRTSEDFRFRIGEDRRNPISARIDFREEHQKKRSHEIKIVDVLWIAPIDYHDLAFLKVETSGPNATSPIPLSNRLVDTDTPVVTIGYPARDDSLPDQQLVKQTFGDVFDKKRLAPGFVTDFGTQDILHDCSTLGGNSGSVVLDLKTGQAVGVHYAGEFMKTNYAVPTTVVAERLVNISRSRNRNRRQASKDSTVSVDHQELKKTIFVPVEISIRIGDPTSAGILSGVTFSGDSRSATSLDQAVSALGDELDGDPNVINVRAGFQFVDGFITDERVIIVVVVDKSATNLAKIPSAFASHPVVVRFGSLSQQLRHQGMPAIDFLERRIEQIHYKTPPPPDHLKLEEVDEEMDAIFHSSPDAGFPVLRDFLRRTEESLVATIYEFDAKHILQELIDALEPDGREFTFVTQKLPKDKRPDQPECDLDSSDCDLDLRRAVVELSEVLGDRFQHVSAPTTMKDQLFATSYHIKVAVRDGEEFWISSGNLKNSGQPNIDPVADGETSFGPLEDNNREWHAVIKNEKLAKTFSDFIKYDFEESVKVHESRPVLEGPRFPFPEVLVPEPSKTVLERRQPQATYFEPLVLNNEKIKIQPLLTPDNYLDFIPDLIQSATERILVQNQSFNLKAIDNEPQFTDLLQALVDQQDNGLDVRIIFRDNSEFGNDNRELLERLSDFGFDTNQIKVQVGCHNKGMIIDSSVVMLGSHNWTNSGILVNRDASLIVHHEEVAKFYEAMFLFDWETLATQQIPESVSGVRVAMPEEETPRGMRRMSLEELLLD